MNYLDKTREELIQEIEELREENHSLKASHQKDLQEMEHSWQALQDSYARFRSYFELPLIGIAITSLEKGWIETNQGIYNMLGYTKEELSNLTWADITHAEDLQSDLENFNSVLAGEIETYFLEKRFIHKNGKIIWTDLSVGCVRKQDGSVDYMVALLQDVTKRKQVEEALQQSEEKFRSLYFNMAEGSAIHRLVYNALGVPEDYIILDVNPAFESQLGISRESVIYKTSRAAYHVEEPPYFEIYSRVAITGKPESFETYFAPLDKYFSISVYSPQNGSFATIFTDITERKKAEHLLIQSEAKLRELNATKDKFFSIIAHDLRSPFSNILGFTDLLKKEVRQLDIESIVKYTDIINSSAQRTFNLLENLLDWARMQHGGIPFEPAPFLLNSVIKHEIAGLKNIAEQKGISLVNETKQQMIITADEAMLGSVLRNLISNAVKFTFKDGRVCIEAKKTEESVEISVSDTGVGMKPDTIRNLFKIETSFSTRGTGNEKGTGLGLLLCKEFVQKHNGSIKVESEPGKGSTFRIFLPIPEDFRLKS